METMSLLWRLPLLLPMYFAPGISIYMHQAAFNFHLKHGPAWYMVKVLHVFWTNVFPLCLGLFLSFSWIVQWEDLRDMKCNPEKYFEGCTSLKEYTRKFSQLADLYSNLKRRKGHLYITQQYDELERRLKQYTEYHKSKSEAGSETHIEKGLSYNDLLRNILEYRKVALIQGCQKLVSMSPQLAERFSRAHDLVCEYESVEKSINNFYLNGWKEEKQILEKSGEVHFDDYEIVELYQESIARSDDLMSCYAYKEYLETSSPFNFEIEVLENYSIQIRKRNAGIVEGSFTRTPRSEARYLRWKLFRI